MGMVAKYDWLPCLFGFLLAVAYVPGILGAGISTGWLYLFIAIPLWALFVQADLKNTHLYGLLFLAYMFVSLLWTYNLNLAYFFLMQMVMLGAVFYIGSTVTNLKPIVIGIAVGLGVSDAVGLLQYIGFHQVFSVSNDVAGLFVNKNIFCEVSVVILLLLIALKLWVWIPVTLPGLLIVHSRAAILGLGAGLIVYVWRWNKLGAVYAALLLGFAGVFFYRHSDLGSIVERYGLWIDTIKGLSPFGNGVGSYEALFPLNAVNIDTYIARPKHAHNDLLQLIFEYGIGSIFIILMTLNVLKIDDDAKIVLYGIGTISLFAYPFHVPVLAFIGVLVAGYLTRIDDTNWIIRDYRGWFLFKEPAIKQL